MNNRNKGGGGSNALTRPGLIGGNSQASVPAPWGSVCLAILLQRASDKTPAVRAKAIQHVASLIDARLELPAPEREAFLTALMAAEAVDLNAAASSCYVRCSSSAVINGTSTTSNAVINGTFGSPCSGKKPGNFSTRRNGENNTPRSTTSTTSARSSSSIIGLTPSHAAAVVVHFPVPAALFSSSSGNLSSSSSSSNHPCGRGVNNNLTSLFHTARQRCRDAKGHVRKSAVQLLQALLLIQAARKKNVGNTTTTITTLPSDQVKVLLSDKDCSALEAAALDPLLSVRKAALIAAAELASGSPRDLTAAALWVSAGLPLIRDPETSIQEAVLDQLEELVMKKISAAKGGDDDGEEMEEVKPLLVALSRSGAAGKGCFGRACVQLRQKGRLQGKKVAAGLERLISNSSNDDDEVCAGAWLVYAEIATQAPSVPSWSFLHSQWTTSTTSTGAAAQQQHQQQQHAPQLLRVIATAAAEFPADRAAALCTQLLDRLQTMTLPPASAAAHVAALAQLTRTLHKTVNGGGGGSIEKMALWASSLLSTCETSLIASVDALRSRKVKQGDTTTAAAVAVTPTALFVVGEVALLRIAGVSPSSRLVTLVQALTSSSLVNVENSSVFVSSQQQQQKERHANIITTTSTEGNEEKEEGITMEDEKMMEDAVIIGTTNTTTEGDEEMVEGITMEDEKMMEDAVIIGTTNTTTEGDEEKEEGITMTKEEKEKATAAREGGEEMATAATTTTTATTRTATKTTTTEEETVSGSSSSIPGSIQAFAWITLGKLCLVNESLAKKCIPLFIQELSRAASPAVRNNIVVALADLVIQYTALVDAHIPRLAACLRDPNELVRTQALGLLANLLQKDYLKWRGPLFMRFMLALIDGSPRVRGMAEYLLGDALDSKLPNLAYNHFVEALFVLNDCQVICVNY